MFDNSERALLQNAFLESQVQLRYYLTLAAVVIIFSWVFYGMTRRSGALIIASITTVAIWYYPWRYYQKGLALKRDLQLGTKKSLTTEIYAKKKSRINRIQPYYYLYTDEEVFEVSENLYQQMPIPQTVYLEYAPESATILSLKLIEQ